MKGNLEAKGCIHLSGKVKYSSITIGTPSKPYQGIPDLSIAFEDGRKIRLSDIPSDRKQLEGQIVSPEESWPDNVWSYGKEGYFFLFSARRLVGFSAAEIWLPGDKFTPTLGDSSTKKMFRFPITQKQLETLTGPPDRIEDTFKW